MTHPDPNKRPSATSLCDHQLLCPFELKSKAQLNHELTLERQKNATLIKKLRETKLLLKSYELSKTPPGKDFAISNF